MRRGSGFPRQASTSLQRGSSRASRRSDSRANCWPPRRTRIDGGASGGSIMARIDESRPFIPVNIAVLTVSDTRTAANDTSGDTLVERITKAGHLVAARAIEKDDAGTIEQLLRRWIADPTIDVVITTGGTGFTG